ncbi:MAG: hypothetical protein PHH20_06505, partial [Candidatus Omnitrophica bacterium]|nr:hypothetical protein [Candidatus Omnitrophota bacterium]
MSKDKKPLLYAAGIVTLGIMAYRSSLFGDFVLDDLTLVVLNSHIQGFSQAGRLFLENIGAGFSQEASSAFYRPLQILSYAADHSFWGLNYAGYHLTNIILHILAALGVFHLIRVITRKDALSFAAAAVFAVHPANTEAVSYISGRADPLSALFIVLCLICYIKYLDTSGVKYYVLFPLLYFCALMSRESGLMLPVLILLYHLSSKRKVTRDLALKLAFPLAAVTAVYLLMRSAALDSMFPYYRAAPLTARLAGFFAAFAEYIRILFLPFGLHMEYGRKVFYFNDPRVIIGALLFAACIYFVAKRRKTGGAEFFFSAWFIAGLIPVSNIFPMGAYMAEHWLYLPSVGFYAVMASAVFRLPKAAAVALSAVILLGLAAATAKQNRYWADPEVFYTRTLEYSPDSARIRTYLDIHN